MWRRCVGAGQARPTDEEAEEPRREVRAPRQCQPHGCRHSVGLLWRDRLSKDAAGAGEFFQSVNGKKAFDEDFEKFDEAAEFWTK